MQLLNRLWEIYISEDGGKFRRIKNPKLRWLADPFIVEHDGSVLVFAESMDKIRKKGELCYAQYSEGQCHDWKTIISEPFHLSFPNVYKYKDKWYMIPECEEAREIRIYEAEAFPNGWKLAKSFKTEDGYVDSVLCFDEGTCRLISYNDTKHTLDLFDYCEEKLVLIDRIEDPERNLRPAGKIFTEDGQQYLPTQVCKDEYGSSMIIRKLKVEGGKITDLTEAYTITAQQVTDDGRNYCGCHTYNRSGKYIATDTVIAALDPAFYVGRVVYKFRVR